MYEIISGLSFYVFSFIAVFSSIMVISVKNSVHAVLLLILTFFCASGLFILIGAEFVAMTLVIVYVGAVAVLFLFVVMMMNINVERIRSGFVKYMPVCILLALVFLSNIIYVIISSVSEVKIHSGLHPISKNNITNSHSLGKVLYTDYVYHFQIAGLLLLVAIISAIVLTLKKKNSMLKQSPSSQIARNLNNSIKIIKVPTGVGIDAINNQ